MLPVLCVQLAPECGVQRSLIVSMESNSVAKLTNYHPRQCQSWVTSPVSSKVDVLGSNEEGPVASPPRRQVGAGVGQL